jgi:heparin/heparan-sulfate lyase
LDTGTRAIQTDYNLKYYFSQTVAHNCILIHKPNEPFAGYWGTTYNGPEGKLSHGGMRGYAGKVRGFMTNDHFSYAAGDATNAYGDKCTEAVRQFIHLQPDYFIVYDRVGAADPSYKKEWLLHTQNEPLINGKVLRADENKGRLFCETLLPKDAQWNLVGGPGKEFWACGKNWDIDEKYLATMRKRKESTGKDALFGNWRLEVSPAQANADDRFLHVLTACEQTVEAPIKTQLIQTDTQDGVIVETFEGKKVTILFNRTGAVAAQITIEQNGKLVGAYSIDETIQPQAGIDIK